MPAAHTASWFFKTGVAFIVAYGICWAAPRVCDKIPDLPATTTDREQAGILDGYFQRPAPKVAIVGSSLTYRLKQEYFRHVDIENVSLPGGSALTGLKIIAGPHKHKPKVVAIETNVLSRAADEVLVDRYRESIVRSEALRPVRALAAALEPKPPPALSLDASIRDEILNAAPAPMLAAGQRMMAEGVVEFNKTSYDNLIRQNAATLKTLVEKARADGVTIYLFELPASPAISQTRYSKTVRSEIARLFGPSDVLSLEYNEDELRWDDGLHLDERSALIVADVLEQTLIAKLSAPLREIHPGWGGVVCLMKCTLCEDSGWVCEDHPDTPWDGEHACSCGGAGMPCPKCNPSDLENPPRPPAGTRVEFDKKGWRH